MLPLKHRGNAAYLTCLGFSWAPVHRGDPSLYEGKAQNDHGRVTKGWKMGWLKDSDQQASARAAPVPTSTSARCKGKGKLGTL